MIPLFKVFVPPGVDEPLLATLHSGFIGEGPKTVEFENNLKGFLDHPYAALVNSGTTALKLALKLAGVAGKEVVSAPLTCCYYDTKVLMEDGKTLPMGKIVEDKVSKNVISLDTITGKIVSRPITNWIKLPIGNHYWNYLSGAHSGLSRCGNKSNQGAFLTEDHNVLTKRGYVAIQNLDKDDLIATNSRALNAKQLDFINGTLLGDSFIQKHKGKESFRLICAHQDRQREWLDEHR